MRTLAITSCCAGRQFLDFPNAHHEGLKSNKETVIELLNHMNNNKGYSFYHAFVNNTQNQQMGPIFKALGWKKHRCGNRVHAYILPNPTDWFSTVGLTNYGIIYDERKYKGDVYIKHNIRIRELMNEHREVRDKFFDTMKKKFKVERTDLAFLGKFE